MSENPGRGKQLLVTGDLIVVANVVRLPSKRTGYRYPCPATIARISSCHALSRRDDF